MKTATKSTPAIRTAFLLSAFSLQALGLFFPGGALRAQTHIPGGASTYIMSGAETEFIVDAGVVIAILTTGAGNHIEDQAADAGSKTIKNYGTLGHTTATPGTNTALQGVLFQGIGARRLENYGLISMGDTPGFTATRYAVRVNVTAGAAGAEIYNSGTIQAGTHGILSNNANPLKIENLGSIIGENKGTATEDYAIYVSQAAPDISILNSGLVRGGVNGIIFYNTSYMYAENFIINNSGTIEATRTNGTLATPSLTAIGGAITIGRVGVAGGSGTIANTGLIRGAGSAIFNTGSNIVIQNTGGTIQSTSFHAIVSNVNAGQVAPFIRVDNAGGIITAAQSAINIATGSAVIMNTAGGSIIGSGGAGLDLAGANIAAFNDASQILGATYGMNITGANASVTNLNAATITGASGLWVANAASITNSAGSLINGTGLTTGDAGIRGTNTGIVTLDNSGTILGGMKGVTLGAPDGHSIINHAGGVILATQEYGAPDLSTPTSTGFTGNASGGITRFLDGASPGAIISSTVVNAGLISGGNNGIFASSGMHVFNTGTIRATGAQIASVYFAAINATESSLTLGTGSVLEGDVLSAKAAGNRLFLEGSGSAGNNFIGVDSTGAFDAANGFESLTMDGLAWTIGGTASITGNAADAIAINGGTLALGGLVAANNAGITFTGGGLLAFNTASDTALGGITGSGTVVYGGPGALSFTGNSGAFIRVIDDGVLRVSSAAQIAAGLVLGGGATAGFLEYTGAGAWTTNLTLDGAGGGMGVTTGTTALNASVTGAGAFMKTGSGALDIRGATLAAGITATEIRDGTLIADKDHLAGDVTLGGAAATLVYEHTGADFDDTRAISGAGNLIKTGAGLLNLTGNVTYAGDTSIEEGTLQGNIGTGGLHVNTGATYKVADGVTDFSLSGITGDGNVDLNASSLLLDVASSGSFYFTGNLTSSNTNSSLVKTGAGTLDLLSAVTLGGGTEIREGVLRLADQTFITTPVLLGTDTTAGLIEYTGAAAWAHDITLATGGAGGFTVAGGTFALGAAFTIDGSGTFIKAGAGALDVRGANFAPTVAATEVLAGVIIGDAASLAGDITLANNATIIYDQAAAATDDRAITGDGSLVKTGAGLLNLTGANAYSGNTTVQSGTLQGNIGAGGLQIDTGATYKVANSVADFQIAGITGAGTLDLNTANLLLDVATSGSFSFSGSLASANPASKFVKTGAGTLDLLSAVALAGGAEIRDGVLRLADQNFISAPVVLGSAATAGLIEYTGAAAWTRDIVLAAGGGGGFSVAAGAQSLSGFNIDGAGDFVKAGAGTLDITNASITDTANGAVRVLDGTLRASASTLKAGGIALEAAGGAVEFYETGDASYDGAITGAGSLVKTGAGSLTLTGANTYGDTLVQSGLLSGNIGAGTLTVGASGTYRVGDSVTAFDLAGLQGNGTLDLAGADLLMAVAGGTTAYSFSGQLMGGNQFVKTGAGAVELQSAVALTGGARIEEGTVILATQSFLNAPVVLGSAASPGFLRFTSPVAWNRAITLAGQGGGFDVDGGATTTVSGIIQSSAPSAQLLKTGAGTLDITDATLNGVVAATVREGTLRASAATLPGTVNLVSENVSSGTSSILEIHERTGAAYSGVVTGTGNVLKTGDGTLTLLGSLANTGSTIIGGGALKLGAHGIFSANSTIVLHPGTTLDLGGHNLALLGIGNLGGSILLDATVNSRAGLILSHNTLTITGAAEGAGRLLVRLAENETATAGGVGSAVIVDSAAPIPYDAALAERAVRGPRDWVLQKSADGRTLTLELGLVSPEIAAAGGLDCSAWLVNRAALSSLADRLAAARFAAGLEKHFQVWAGYMHREDTLDTELYAGAKSKINGFQAGAEWKPAGRGSQPLFIGVFADRSSADFTMENRISESRATVTGFGAYLSYRTKPLYIDLLLRQTREKYDIDVHYAGTHSFKTDGQGMAASLEVGGIITRNTSWNVEPQLQIAWQRHSIDDATDGVGRPVSVDSDDSYDARAGVRVWRDFALAGGRVVLRPHLRASLIYTANAKSAVSVGGATFDNKFTGQITQLDGGLALQWRNGFHLGAGAAWHTGSKLDGFTLNAFAGFAW